LTYKVKGSNLFFTVDIERKEEYISGENQEENVQATSDTIPRGVLPRDEPWER
jgi:hypothetical protein